MFSCAFCKKDGKYDKYFVCPSYIYRPNMYTVCEEHREMSLKWEDVYPVDNCIPVTTHEANPISPAII